MKILSVSISNMLSIEEAHLAFEDKGLVLLEGWNYDDNKANGAGKTAIFNAISYGLYSKLPRKITATEILKTGAKTGYVIVRLILGTDIYSIQRFRPKTEVIVKKNDAKIDITQEEFEALIRLTYDQFLISMYTAQSADSKFINKNDSGKKDFLLKLLNLGEFALCKKNVDEDWSILEKETTKLNLKLEAALSKASAYRDAIENVEDLNLKIKANDESLLRWDTEIKEAQTISKPDISRYLTLEGDITSKINKILEAKTKRSMLSTQYREVSIQDVPYAPTKPDALCPYCDGALKIKDSTLAKSDDEVAMREQHKKHNETVKAKLNVLKQKIDELDVIVSKESELSELSRKLKLKKDGELEEYNKATNKIANLRSMISSKKEQNRALQESINRNAEISSKIEVLSKEADRLSKEVSDNNLTLELFGTISQVYSSTGAQAYVLDSIVDSFNESVISYIGMIWPNASYLLRSYKESVKGDISAKFSEELIVSGKVSSIGSLSGGELRCLSLCIDFAVIDILSKQFGMALNPIIMDEPFEGLDAASRETVIGLLERLSVDRQIWVIDHATEVKAMFNKVVRIEKRGGTSNLVL